MAHNPKTPVCICDLNLKSVYKSVRLGQQIKRDNQLLSFFLQLWVWPQQLYQNKTGN